MESTLFRTLKGETMAKIFDSDLLNVRYFEAIDCDDAKEFNPSQTYRYKITIRHSEAEKADTLLDQARKVLEKNEGN